MERRYTRQDNNGVHVLVFGSNLAGRHGLGAALDAARDWGAVEGVGEGRTGMAYALPTKDHHLAPLPLDRIAEAARRFLAYARAHEEHRFLLTRIGCGYRKLTDHQVAPLFHGAPPHVVLPDDWEGIIEEAAHAPRKATLRDFL